MNISVFSRASKKCDVHKRSYRCNFCGIFRFENSFTRMDRFPRFCEDFGIFSKNIAKSL